MLNQNDLKVIHSRGEDVRCDFGGPSKERNKFAAWINLFNGDDFHRPIINTNAIFDTAEQAKSWAERFVEAVRTMPDPGFFGFFSEDDLKTLSGIISELATLERAYQALAET